jgi:hypothetical protein
MASRKKAVLRKFTHDFLSGFVGAQDIVHNGRLEMLDLNGNLAQVALEEVKMLCYVRDFTAPDPANPERLVRKTFTTRPRSEGLWLRLYFRDGDLLEGLASNGLSLLDPDGLWMAPPDTRSNTQRIFVPRTALEAFEVVAVIRHGAHRRSAKAMQEHLFAP